MLDDVMGKQVTIYFLDGSQVKDGTLEAADDAFLRYRTEYQVLYIPITSVRAVALDTKSRPQTRVGFAP